MRSVTGFLNRTRFAPPCSASLPRLPDWPATSTGWVSRKQAELEEARKRLGNLIDFVARGEAPGSLSLGAAITERECCVSRIDLELADIRRSDAPAFPLPSAAWIAECVGALQELLECRSPESSALVAVACGA